MSYTINDQKFRKLHKPKLKPHQEIAALIAALEASPHSPDCLSLTPRPMSISAFFDYSPPNCTCHKMVLTLKQEDKT